MNFNVTSDEGKNKILLEINEDKNRLDTTSGIDIALEQAKLDIRLLDETIESVKTIKQNCDKIDYALAASSGALCGILDMFFVGKPGETPLGNITDKWFADRTEDFAKKGGWKPKGEAKLENAIKWLEEKFKIPYDQTGIGEAAKEVFGFNTDPSKHHLESLGHNPSILGLFFSILDQFTNRSHFVIDGQLISLVEADDKFKLRGSNIISKLYCGFCNWFGHLISDMSGAYNSAKKGKRGMGIPSPLWTWINDIIVIKRKLGISESEFDKSMNQIAVDLFKEGYDFRYQSTQVIPVLINELIVRFFYSIRRLLKYYNYTSKGNCLLNDMWYACKPFGNPTITRMLMVAHGTFCLVDIADATARGFATGVGTFNPVEFFLRLNLVGIGRLTLSLYGEVKCDLKYHKTQKEAQLVQDKKAILKDYIEGLKILKALYEDEEYLSFIDDLSNNEYIVAFIKSSDLATLRGVPDSQILKTKEDIDKYFNA